MQNESDVSYNNMFNEEIQQSNLKLQEISKVSVPLIQQPNLTENNSDSTLTIPTGPSQINQLVKNLCPERQFIYFRALVSAQFYWHLVFICISSLFHKSSTLKEWTSSRGEQQMITIYFFLIIFNEALLIVGANWKKLRDTKIDILQLPLATIVLLVAIFCQGLIYALANANNWQFFWFYQFFSLLSQGLLRFSKSLSINLDIKKYVKNATGFAMAFDFHFFFIGSRREFGFGHLSILCIPSLWTFKYIFRKITFEREILTQSFQLFVKHEGKIHENGNTKQEVQNIYIYIQSLELVNQIILVMTIIHQATPDDVVKIPIVSTVLGKDQALFIYIYILNQQ